MIRTPTQLTPESRKLWRETLAGYELEPHHLKLLESACRAWDRIVQAQEQINKDGAYFKDRYDQFKPHPALEVENKNRNMFMRLIRELALDIEPPKESRPPRQY